MRGKMMNDIEKTKTEKLHSVKKRPFFGVLLATSAMKRNEE
jgi:hypothetical protein